jgi:hypothetical protein
MREERSAMTDQPTCDWTGGSGKTYRHYVYELPVRFDPDQDGNYIYAKLEDHRYWVPIYIGQGNLNDRANSHHQAECLRRKGATHFHCHLNSAEGDRLREESDLLTAYTRAYQPTGCNERTGG